MKKRRWIFIFLSPAFLFLSCATKEIQLSSTEINNSKPNLFLLDVPATKIVYSIPQGDLTNAKRLRESFPYKLKSASGIFNDSLNEKINLQLKTDLDSLGFEVYRKNDLVSFQQNEQNSFVIEPLYSEIRERHLLYIDRYDDGDNQVFFDTTYSSFEFTLKFKVYPINDSSLAEPILSAVFVFSDIPEGYWEWSNRDQSWSYAFNFTQAETNDIAFFVSYAIRQTASYFRDFFINLALDKESKNRKKNRKIYYRLVDNGRLKEADNERFQFE